MYEIVANTEDTIPIGYAGENESRQVKFEYPESWIEEFVDGDLELHVKRAGDSAVYVAENVTNDDSTHTLTWTVSSTDTSYTGLGEVQLCYVKNGKIVKSQRYKTYVATSTALSMPIDPPPDTVIEEAVENYLEQYVDVITVSNHGEDGQILQSNGDGSYSWLTVTDPVVDSDTGNTLVPTRTLNRLARAIRAKTGYEGDMTVETMAEVLEQTDMWTTEEYCLNLAPAAAELTITLGALPQYALYGRQNISKVVLPYCGRINTMAVGMSNVSIIEAPKVTIMGSSAFNGSSMLVEIHFPELVTLEGGCAFYNCTALSTARFPKLKYINSSTFYTCISLIDVDLPELVQNNGSVETVDSVFINCRTLPRIELPKFQGVFRASWFDGCYLLKEAVFPKLSKITGNYNFRNCYSLEKVYAPECTVWNGTQNFLNCNSLRRMCFYVKPTSISNSLFSGAPVLMDIYVPWAQGEVVGAPWGAPAGCTVHYNTVYDEDGEPIT